METQEVNITTLERWSQTQPSITTPEQEEEDEPQSHKLEASDKPKSDDVMQLLDSAIDKASRVEEEEATARTKKLDQEEKTKKKRRSPFPCNPAVNSKLILWKGELLSLKVDAVVNTTNEKLNDATGVSGRVFQTAGPGLQPELVEAEGCPTGDAIITKGHNLLAKHIIHTVGPRYSVKYQTAAENALHGCYRRCLELLVDNKLASIAFPVVNTERKGYPRKPAANIALRTIRRFLEKYGESVESVVLCVGSNPDLELYQEVVPLYFPRNLAEHQLATKLLPDDLGNEMGERVIEERKIRIIGSIPGADPKFLAMPQPTEARKPNAAPARLDRDFIDIQEDPDKVRREKDALKPKSEQALEAENRRYNTYLEAAREADLSDLEQLNFIYQSGMDSFGRPIIVIVASAIPATKKETLDRVLLYMIRVLDPIVVTDYNVVYLHTGFRGHNKPPFAWLKLAYSIFNRKYKKNLKRLFLVHPTTFIRMVNWFVQPFVSKKFWRKLHYIHRLRDIYESFDARTLQIPEHILKWDQDKYGSEYARGVENPDSAGKKKTEDEKL